METRVCLNWMRLFQTIYLPILITLACIFLGMV